MKTYTIRLLGTEGVPALVETNITPGIGIHLTGLPEQEQKEALLRTLTGIQACGWCCPGKKIVINYSDDGDPNAVLASADLPLALSILAASGQADIDPEGWMLLGQVWLDGTIHPVPGYIQAVEAAITLGCKGVIIPDAGLDEIASVFTKPMFGIRIHAARTLRDAVDILSGKPFPDVRDIPGVPAEETHPVPGTWDIIHGNEGVKRALEIAAAGGHHVILAGPPSPERRLFAKALLDILPPMTWRERLERARARSVQTGVWTVPTGYRSLRAPHHSCATYALLGGGPANLILPGEVTLASGGVLLLDEVPVWPKALMEGLRRPLEDRTADVVRRTNHIKMPADFQLVATTSPCPCGHYGQGNDCKCTPAQRRAYLSRIYGPLYDHIDVQAWVTAQAAGTTGQEIQSEPAAAVAARVQKAREMQMQRQGKLNGSLNRFDLSYNIMLHQDTKKMIETLIERLGLSVRSYSKIIKIAKTIADLEGCEDIAPHHAAEAASLRFMDRLASEFRNENHSIAANG